MLHFSSPNNSSIHSSRKKGEDYSVNFRMENSYNELITLNTNVTLFIKIFCFLKVPPFSLVLIYIPTL